MVHTREVLVIFVTDRGDIDLVNTAVMGVLGRLLRTLKPENSLLKSSNLCWAFRTDYRNRSQYP